MIYFLIGFAILLIIFIIIDLKVITIKNYELYRDIVPTEGLDNFILISDLHGCSFGKNNIRLIKKIENCSSKNIFIAGDLISEKKQKDIKTAISLVKSLNELGYRIIYCPGNHEKRLEIAKPAIYNEFIAQISQYATVLYNSSIKYGNCTICGYNPDNEFFKQNVSKEDIFKALNNINITEKEDIVLLIAHDPIHFKEYALWGADIVLSGHVHGGIIRIPFLGGFISPRYRLFPFYDKGIFDSDKSTMILSSGLGWHDLPIRFLNFPEVVQIKIKTSHK